MRRNIACIIQILVLIMVMNYSCTHDNIAGSGSSSGNAKILGKVIDLDSTSQMHTVVKCIWSDYNPLTGQLQSQVLYDTTDGSGTYNFTVEAGTYNVKAVNSINGHRFLRTGLVAVSDSLIENIDTLKIPGAIKISIPQDVVAAQGYIYVVGTDILVYVDGSADTVLIDSLPAGLLPQIYSSIDGDATVIQKLSDGVEVISGEIVDISMVPWSYSRIFTLNTTQSGAGISGDVTGFPVLIRLSNSNFDFSQAKGNGADIRFTKSDSTAIPYEFERWDSVSGLAEIWVRVDTVYGNNNSQFIIMFWGNLDAQDNSKSSDVFHTNSNFQGVWHMGQNGNAIAYDATVNRYDGTPFGMTGASAVEGMIGISQEFDGATSYIQMNGTADSKLNFTEDGAYTLSAWAYTDTSDSLIYVVLAKGNYQYALQLVRDEWKFNEFADSVGWEGTSSPAVEKQWFHVVGVRNGTQQYIYLNGQCADSTIAITPHTSRLRETGFDLIVGKTEGDGETNFPFFYNGKIDEVRVSSVARTGDWIKLSYMNQKAEDGLVMP